MKDIRKLIAVLGLALITGACSSSDKTEDEFGDTLPEEIPVADANTDALPAEGAESFDEPVPGFADDVPPMADMGAPVSDPAPMDAGMGGSGQYQDYMVQAGDTLMKIAFETYGDLYQWRRIYEANRDKLQDPNVLPAGVSIRVESPSSPVVIERNGERYLIKKGDTLGKISTDVYGTASKWRKIWENNRQMIKNPDEIFAGFYVYYPLDGDMPTTSPAPVAGGGMGSEPAAAMGTPPAPAGGAAPADDGFGSGGDDWGDAGGFDDGGFGDSAPADARQPSSQ